MSRSLKSVAEEAYRRQQAGTRGEIPKSKARRMNVQEQAYHEHLEALRMAGEIQWFRFEGIRLRIGPGAWYTPDFFVRRTDGQLECHEWKGHWRPQARVRIKAAAEQFPFFRFIAIQSKAKRWQYEEIAPC